MTNGELFQLIQQTLQRPLTSLEKLVILVIEESYRGRRYRHMADESGYVEEYVKQVGAKLWVELSRKTGSTVTKKNLRLIFGCLDAAPQLPRDEVGGCEQDRVVEAEPKIIAAIAPHSPLPQPIAQAFDFPSGPLPLAGHPYLANLSFYSLAQQGQTVPDVLNGATTKDSIFHSHLHELWAQLRQNPTALTAWQQVIAAQGQGCSLNTVDTMHLENLGMIDIQNGLAYPLCDLYQRFFTAQFSEIT